MSVEIDPRSQPDNEFLDSFGPHNPATVPSETVPEEDGETGSNALHDYLEELLDRSA